MKYRVLSISLTMNAAFVVGACLLFYNIEAFLQEMVADGYTHRVSQFEAFPLATESVVMLGDSITENAIWDEIYPDLPIRNRGIGGDTTTGVLARLSQITEGKPTKLFLAIGTNDLTHGPKDRKVSYAQYREIVSRIQKASPSTDIFLLSLFPRSAYFRSQVEEFNSEIGVIASEMNVEYVDLYPSFISEDGSMRSELSADELHLNGEGYLLWKSLLIEQMSR